MMTAKKTTTPAEFYERLLTLFLPLRADDHHAPLPKTSPVAASSRWHISSSCFISLVASGRDEGVATKLAAFFTLARRSGLWPGEHSPTAAR